MAGQHVSETDKGLAYFYALYFHLGYGTSRVTAPYYVEEALGKIVLKKFHWRTVQSMVSLVESQSVYRITRTMQLLYAGARTALPPKDYGDELAELNSSRDLALDSLAGTHERILAAIRVIDAVDALSAAYASTGLKWLLPKVAVLEEEILNLLARLPSTDPQWVYWQGEILPWIEDARDTAHKLVPERVDACAKLLATYKCPESMPNFLYELHIAKERREASEIVAKRLASKKRKARSFPNA